MFITVVFIIAEIGESSMPLKGCMDEEDVYTHTEMLLSHKKHEISLVLTTWMDLEGIMLNEISKKDKYSDFTLRQNIRKTNKKCTYIKMTKPNKNQHTDAERRGVVARGEGAGRG